MNMKTGLGWEWKALVAILLLFAISNWHEAGAENLDDEPVICKGTKDIELTPINPVVRIRLSPRCFCGEITVPDKWVFLVGHVGGNGGIEYLFPGGRVMFIPDKPFEFDEKTKMFRLNAVFPTNKFRLRGSGQAMIIIKGRQERMEI